MLGGALAGCTSIRDHRGYLIDATLVEFDEGGLVAGTVVKIDSDEVLLDIGFKSEGVIPSKELSIRNDVNPSEIVTLGEELEDRGVPLLFTDLASDHKLVPLATEVFADDPARLAPVWLALDNAVRDPVALGESRDTHATPRVLNCAS